MNSAPNSYQSALPGAQSSLLTITGALVIPLSEIRFTAVRSSGPGGQHVNTTATKVVLWFDVAGSPSLNEGQRIKIMERLSGRIGADGRLHIAMGSTRSLKTNKDKALDLFVQLLRDALRPVKKRRPTRVSRTQKKKRLESKRKRGEVKRMRSGRISSDE